MTIKELYNEFLRSEGICTDSRNITPGSLYFALKGETFDGNDFATEALHKGCNLAVVDRPSLKGNSKTVVVGSALQTLQDLASFHRNQKKIEVLAITGSNGKTTTKELVAAVLQKKFKVLATSGNLNNHIGVPLTLLNIKDEEFSVIEMGANHAGEIGALAEIVSPDYGIITNIGKAHLEGFGSVKGVLEAKGELYQYLKNNGKKAFLNVSNEMLLDKANAIGVEFIPYNNNRINGKIVDVYPVLKCEIYLDKHQHMISSQLVGAYNLENILTAFAVGNYFGVPAKDIIDAIENYRPEKQRSQLIRGKRNTVVLDAYNANPSSMKESISDFINYTSGPKMAILGDMFELGEEEDKEHSILIKWLDKKPLEIIIFVGKAFEKAGRSFPGYQYFPDIASCINYLKDEYPVGFHILVKGSRKMALELATIHLID